MNNSFSILFYPKRTTSAKNNTAVLYVRLTYNGKRADFTTSRKIAPNKWNKHGSIAKGNSDESKAINRYLDSIRSKLYDIHDRLIRDNQPISAKIIKDIYFGKGDEQERMLMEIFQEHNDGMKKLIGKGYSKGTMQRYNACKKHIEEYLLFAYKKKDIPIQQVDHKFITGLDHYLKSQKNCAHNTALKYIVNFKKIIRIAYANQWIDRDPFFHWKGSWKSSEREFLTDSELQEMAEKEFEIPRLELVRDIFLFCCYTGLAFADVKKLSEDDIVLGINGKKWIKTKRQKTKSLSSIPLLDVPASIIEKYKDNPQVRTKNIILPVLTNQKSNAYLKEIADLCGIKKNLTTHLARHTFATTVTLSKGVPIESVGKMLGHRSLKTTQIYAKVLDEKVGRDMEVLESRLSN
ncbi:site-specific integrase [Christiangramia sp.]|uniref:site-specific integrase n=1 Tax=Christiangramia sp. TaxID=1931228 RepID=UPI002638C538|nr:site-specific integrase [Christiangramia sp.]